MGENQRSRRRGRRCRGSGEDRISGLPDELLHDILVRLRSAHTAARTSVISRRWRHVWDHLPELRLIAPREAAPASFVDTIDAALGGYKAPTLEHLGVSISSEQLWRDLGIPARRIAPWLHFAAEHVVGELYLYLRLPQWYARPGLFRDRDVQVLELPACERAKRIELSLAFADTMWLRPQASGMFTALTSLKISGNVRMEGSDLTALVSTQCPCLMYLDLFIKLIVKFDIIMHSNSLHTLLLRVLKIRRLEVVAPRLKELTIYDQPNEAHISAPSLVKVAWHAAYDPHLNRFVDVGHTLQLLRTFRDALSLTTRFDEVDGLNLNIGLNFPDVGRYESFFNETKKLPKCKSFIVCLWWDHHALVPIMLHLLRSCNGTKKFRVQLWNWSQSVMLSCPPSCPCHLEESHKIDGIDLSSLEEVEITSFSGSHEQMQLVEFLSCSAGNLKRLVINDRLYRWPKEAREKVRSMCHPNVRVEFFEFYGNA